MSYTNINAFIERLKIDTKLQEELKQATDAAATLAIVRSAGFDLTAADLMSLQAVGRNNELSDAELATVAGGMQVLTGAELENFVSSIRVGSSWVGLPTGYQRPCQNS